MWLLGAFFRGEVPVAIDGGPAKFREPSAIWTPRIGMFSLLDGLLTYATLSPKAWITERLVADAAIFCDTADCTTNQDVLPIA